MACPKCGDQDAAVFYSVLCYDHRVVTWDGVDQTGEITALTRPKTGVCGSCKKRVTLPGPKEALCES